MLMLITNFSRPFFFSGCVCRCAKRAQISVTTKTFRHGDGVVIRASASQSLDPGFNLLVESYKKTLNGVHSFPAWRLAFRGGCGEQVGKFACCVLGQGTQRDAPTFMRKTGGLDTSEMATSKRARTSRPKYSNTIRFLVNGG